MSDEELRELERKQQADPSIENATRLVHARARRRAGSVSL